MIVDLVLASPARCVRCGPRLVSGLVGCDNHGRETQKAQCQNGVVRMLRQVI